MISCLLVCFSIQAQTNPNWYPNVDGAAATYINHEGEEEEIESGNTYDAPLTVTFSANPMDTAGYDVRYEWKI